MTYELECQIEELRAELRNGVNFVERREIEVELASAQARLAEEEAAFEALMAVEPPH